MGCYLGGVEGGLGGGEGVRSALLVLLKVSIYFCVPQEKHFFFVHLITLYFWKHLFLKLFLNMFSDFSSLGELAFQVVGRVSYMVVFVL